jgi:hypothetical protein
VDDDQPTRNQPPADQPPAGGDPSAAETAPFPRPATDETSVLPAAETPPEAPAKWSARAGVPVHGPRQAAPQEQAWVPDQEPRTWWAPLLIVLAILVLLGLIGLGLWLAMRGQPAVGPSASAAPSSAASSASPSPSPTPSQSTSVPPTVTMVPVPGLRGVSVSDAEQILQSQGLNSKVVTRVSDLPAGTVIETNPPANALVPAGTEVTLFVATPPPSPSSPSPSSPSPAR